MSEFSYLVTLPLSLYEWNELPRTLIELARIFRSVLAFVGIYISVAPLGEICYCLPININITTSIYPLYHSIVVSVLAGHV